MNNDQISVTNVKDTTKLYSIKKIIYLFFKRTFDILISIVGLIPLIILAIIVKITYVFSGDFNSIFYKHKRIGKKGVEFNLYKFRTMVPNSAEILEELLKDPEYKKEWRENHKFEHDPRVTKMGKILRVTSLDELPQILNILNGTMSLIGPRPLIEEEVRDYKKDKDKLLSVKPGLTGWWAVNGRSCTSNKERMKLELYYVDHQGFKLDIKIFFMTFVKVLKREGAK